MKKSIWHENKLKSCKESYGEKANFSTKMNDAFCKENYDEKINLARK